MMKRKQDKARKEREERAIRYIDSQIAQLNDGYLIEYLIKAKKEIQKDLNKTPQKRYRESLFVNGKENSTNHQKSSRRLDIQKESSQTHKPEIKNRPNKFSTKTFFYGVIAGVIIGIPAGSIAYNSVKNLPSSHNYITVEEARKGITDRKDHDSSSYKKYLMKKFDLTEEEAEERIQKEEEEGKWER